jgi:tetratricopeptide (TPR) repeat protein
MRVKWIPLRVIPGHSRGFSWQYLLLKEQTVNGDNRIQKNVPYLNLQLDGAGPKEEALCDGVGAAAAAIRVELLLRRANSFYAMTDWDSAMADFLEALKINPKCDAAMVRLADCHQCKREFDKAIDLYTQALALVPNNAYAYAWRGGARCNLCQFAAALADYNEAIRLDPNQPLYYSGRGSAYSGLGKHDLAMRDHDRAFRLAEQQ